MDMSYPEKLSSPLTEKSTSSYTRSTPAPQPSVVLNESLFLPKYRYFLPTNISNRSLQIGRDLSYKGNVVIVDGEGPDSKRRASMREDAYARLLENKSIIRSTPSCII